MFIHVSSRKLVIKFYLSCLPFETFCAHNICMWFWQKSKKCYILLSIITTVIQEPILILPQISNKWLFHFKKFKMDNYIKDPNSVKFRENTITSQNEKKNSDSIASIKWYPVQRISRITSFQSLMFSLLMV